MSVTFFGSVVLHLFLLVTVVNPVLHFICKSSFILDMCVQNTHTYIHIWFGSIYNLDSHKETDCECILCLFCTHTHIHTHKWWVAVGFKERKAVIDMCSENNSSAQWVQNHTV